MLDDLSRYGEVKKILVGPMMKTSLEFRPELVVKSLFCMAVLSNFDSSRYDAYSHHTYWQNQKGGAERTIWGPKIRVKIFRKVVSSCI